MENKFIGLRDPHLNVFYTYGDKNHLENNITKAFVNVLESLSDEQLKKVVKELFNYNLPDGALSKDYYLQRKPSMDLVEKYPNRILFAFSPTGKPRGINGIDTKEVSVLREELSKIAKETVDNKEEQKQFVEEELKKIMDARKDKGSIPDGWLFIDVNNKPELVVAMENKLHDLDQTQLYNHSVKSLLSVDKKLPTYEKYSRITELFTALDSFLGNQFVEYMVILGYEKIKDFSLACQAVEQVRQDLLIDFGNDILDLVHEGKKDKREKYMARCHVDEYAYLREINLRFNKEDIELWLSFGATQDHARKMLSKIDHIHIHDKNFYSEQTFHIMYYRGRIIWDSYGINMDLDEYIAYWKENIDLVKTSTPDEAITLYGKLKNDNKINDKTYEKVVKRLTGKKNDILVIPEISLVFRWSYDEASKLGIEGLADSIKEKLYISLSEMKLK